MRTFCRDLARSIPNIVRINRGKLSLTEVAEKALENDADKVVIVDRWKGGPGKIRLFEVSHEGLRAVPPLICVKGVRFQRTFEKAKVRSVRSLALVLSGEKTDQISKIEDAFSDFFEIPILSMEEAVKSFQAAMVVSSDSMERMRISFLLLPERVEMGPRISVSHVIWEIGR